MRKVISIAFAFSLVGMMMVGLTGCYEEVTITTRTANGITIDVPSDFGEFKNTNNVMIVTDENSYASIGITVAADSQNTSVTDWTKENYQENALKSLTEVIIIEFDNTAKIGETPTLFIHYTAKNTKEVSVDGYNYLIYLPDGKFQSVTISFDTNSNNKLKDNPATIKTSIKIEQ